MFFIQYRKNNLYGVTDTSDGITEWYTIEQIREYINQGVAIKGLRNSIPLCKSDYIIKDFTEAIRPLLAKLKVLGVHSNHDIVNHIVKLAIEFGIIENVSQFHIDINTEKVLIKSYFDHIIDYSKEGNKVIDKIDVCNKEVSKLSKLGIEAFNHITLKVGNDVITLSDLINEISVASANSLLPEDIWYIGITPSNKMFKIMANGRYISVKISTVEYIKENKYKILGTKVSKVSGFGQYINDLCIYSNKSWGISKMSIKSYSTGIDLKEKYPTIHDVYERLS